MTTWVKGSVTINATTGAASGSGFALALYNELATRYSADAPLPDPNTPDADWEDTKAAWAQLMTPVVVSCKKRWAAEASAIAESLDPILSNFESRIATNEATLANHTTRLHNLDGL